MNGILGTIRIGMDPDMVEWGSFVLTWHGFFTFVAVAVSVTLIAYWAKKEGIAPDTVYSVAVWAIISGVIGSRILHVIDFWGRIYKHDVVSVFYVWEGGITIIGGILGGFLGGAAYMSIRNRPGFINFWNGRLSWLGRLERVDMPQIGRLADIVVLAVPFSMAIGRIGDIINGEHIARVTTLPWGFVYNHPKTQQLYVDIGASHSSLAAQHPAVVYEIILDLFVLGMVWFVFKGRLRPHGMLFAAYGAMYALGRFFISFVRQDKEWLLSLDEAQIVCLMILAFTVFLLISKAQVVKRIRRPVAPVRTPVPGEG